MPEYVRPACVVLTSLVLAATAGVGPARSKEPAPGNTAEVPVAELVDATLEAQRATELTAPRAMARAALAASLAEYARPGHAAEVIESLAQSRGLGPDLQAELALIGKRLRREPDPSVVRELALLGPFQDTGGGLTRVERAEANGFVWGPKDDYSWGSVRNRWRVVPHEFVRASGVPLDAFVHPRAESCSYVVTFVELEAAKTFRVQAAGTGALRLYVDGKPIAESDELHAASLFDRLGARVEAERGLHSVAIKVCSGPLGDAGLVRLRLREANGAPLTAPVRPRPSQPALAPSRAVAEGVPLRAALEQGSALTGLVLLTAGGADDAKSPRASGLAEGLARAGSSDAFAAALVTLLAPSRGLRSEVAMRWSAAAQKPSKLGSYFARRAVEAALAGGLTDYAHALFLGAGLDQRSDAETILLRAHIDEATGSEVFRHAAQARVTAAVRSNPKAAPDAMLQWLASHAPTPTTAREAALELQARRKPGLYALTAIGGLEAQSALQARATALFEGQATRADELIAAVRFLETRGLAGEARPLAYLLVSLFAPNRSDAFELYADLAKRSGHRQDVLPALARATVLAPGDARLRTELAYRATTRAGGAEPGHAPQAWDQKYLVSSERALAHRKDKPTSDFAERQLYWLRAVELHDDGRVSQMMHYTREIGIASRSDDDRYENLPAEADLTEILRARVHRKDGSIAFPAEEHAEASDTRLKWPALEKGDVVEVAVRQWTERSVGGRRDPPFYFLDYGASTETRPLLENAVVVAYPRPRAASPGEAGNSAAKKLHVSVVRPGEMERKETDEGDRHVVELRWKAPKNVPDEPLSPPMSEIVPLVVGSSYGSWAEFFAWYNEAVRRFADPDAEVRRLAAELTKGKTAQADKVKALFDFVADKIRYVNYVSGEWWLPNRPQEVLARREGDCDDKALLLISLLAAVGIHAEEVLVQTRMTGMPSVLQAPGVAAPLFDHGIAFLPGPNGGTYLDATSPASRLGPLPAMDARAPAARVDQASITTLPNAKPEDHGRNARYEIELAESGEASLDITEIHSGDAAFWLRSELQEAGARNNYVEDNLLGPIVSTAKLASEVSFVPELARGKAEVKYKAQAFALARRESDALVLGLSRDVSLTTTYAPLTTRTLPLLLPPDTAPSHDIREFVVKAPAGFSLASVPRAGEVKAIPFGKASVATRKDARGRLVVRRELSLDQHRIEPQDYPAFRKFLQDADALLRQSVRFAVEPAANAKPKAGAR